MKYRDSSSLPRWGGRVCFALISVWGALMAPARADTTIDAGAPEIAISLRGVAHQTIEQGEALRIAVELDAPAGATGPLELAPATGTWADAISVEIFHRGAAVALVRADVLGRPDTPAATLSRDQVAGGIWRISAKAMAAVGPGDYVVRARLVISSGAGWTGEVGSDDMDLHVVAATAHPGRMTQRVLGESADALAAGDLEAAAQLLDTVLAQDPDNIPLLTQRALVAQRAGNNLAALACVNRASRLSASGAREPSLELLEVRDRVTDALLAPVEAALPPAPPPLWTWPPRAVLQPPPTGAAVKRPVPVANPVAAPRPPVAPSTGPVEGSGSGTVMPKVTAQKPAVAPPSFTGVIISATEFTDAKILADTAGQWAASATAGTQYGKTQYSAAKATGAPNVPVAGNSPDAWCPASKTSGTDWLEVTFAKPVHATEVRVRQNDAVGAIAKIEAIDPGGTAYVWWEGVDPFVASAVRDIVWFAVRVPKTDYLVAKVKITLNLAAGPGWKEIDAVQLVGDAP